MYCEIPSVIWDPDKMLCMMTAFTAAGAVITALCAVGLPLEDWQAVMCIATHALQQQTSTLQGQVHRVPTI